MSLSANVPQEKGFRVPHSKPFKGAPAESTQATVRVDFSNQRNTPPRVFFLPNPNSPTGNLLSLPEIRRILTAAKKTMVVIDEAYFEFSGVTVIPWIRRYPNLIVTRTFSKTAGLAGLRLGCIFVNRELGRQHAQVAIALSGKRRRARRR